MKRMKRFASRFCALLLVLTVSAAALAPAASAAKAQLPDLPSDQCVVDDAGILSSSTTTTIQNLNTQLTEQCDGAQIGVLTVIIPGVYPRKITLPKPSTHGASAVPAKTTVC